MISTQITKSLELCLKEKVHPKIIVEKCFSISGGCINNAIQLETNKVVFFAKYNTNAKLNMFQTEYDGLKILKRKSAIYIPETIAFENNFTSLVVSYNTALTDLSCGQNQLTALDLSANTALTTLYCNENHLCRLKVRGAMADALKR